MRLKRWIFSSEYFHLGPGGSKNHVVPTYNKDGRFRMVPAPTPIPISPWPADSDSGSKLVCKHISISLGTPGGGGLNLSDLFCDPP